MNFPENKFSLNEVHLFGTSAKKIAASISQLGKMCALQSSTGMFFILTSAIQQENFSWD